MGSNGIANLARSNTHTHNEELNDLLRAREVEPFDRNDRKSIAAASKGAFLSRPIPFVFSSTQYHTSVAGERCSATSRAAQCLLNWKRVLLFEEKSQGVFVVVGADDLLQLLRSLRKWSFMEGAALYGSIGRPMQIHSCLAVSPGHSSTRAQRHARKSLKFCDMEKV